MLGGFRAHSTAEKRKTELETILNLFPADLTEQIATTHNTPNPEPTSSSSKSTTPQKAPHKQDEQCQHGANRVRNMKFKRQKVTEPAQKIYASPSKQFHMRQRDAKTHALFQTLKSMFPEEDQEHVAFEISTCRGLFP